MDQNDFIKGALIGGVLGGIAALLLAPKAGRDLRDDILDGYDCVNRTSHDFVDNVKEQSHHILNKLQGIEEEKHSPNSMLAGGAIGSIIGVVAALLLAPQAGDKLRSQLGDKYDDIHHKAEKAIKGLDNTRHNLESKIDDWKDIFGTIVNQFASHKGGKKGSSHDLVDLAALGLRLYEQFNKGR